MKYIVYKHEHYRQIPWTQLSIPIAVQAIECNRRITKPRLVKTLYDNYDDDLYKTEEKILLCPLYQIEKDTTEHLYAWSHLDAIAMVNVANTALLKICFLLHVFEPGLDGTVRQLK